MNGTHDDDGHPQANSNELMGKLNPIYDSTLPPGMSQQVGGSQYDNDDGDGDDGKTIAQYEVIPGPERKRKEPHPPGVMENNNILYGTTDVSVNNHKALTMKSQQQHKLNPESLSPEPQDYIKEEWFMGGACRKACVMLVVLVLCVMLVAALAAGMLALIITFTGSCKCNNNSTMVELTNRIMELEEIVTNLSPPVTTPPAMNTPATSLLEGVATLTDVNLFQNCSTSVEVTCNVPSGDGTGVCFTDPLVPINRSGEIILNMNCLRTMETDEANPLIATLDIFNDTAGCVCAVPDLDTNGRRLHDVECGLQVTRCITPQNITVSYD